MPLLRVFNRRTIPAELELPVKRNRELGYSLDARLFRHHVVRRLPPRNTAPFIGVSDRVTRMRPTPENRVVVVVD
jgi:hypothetical protein